MSLTVPPKVFLPPLARSTIPDVDVPTMANPFSNIIFSQKSKSSHIIPKDIKFYDERVLQLRSRNLVSRAEAFELRRKLRDRRTQIGRADEAFMKAIREHRSNVSHFQWDGFFDIIYQELQTTRDAYGLLEEQYDEVEEQLDREEYELMKSEKSAKIPFFEVQSHRETDSEVLSNVSTEDEGSGPFHGEHRRWHDAYLSRLGDADICREAHMSLRLEYERLQEAQAVRARVGLELLPEDRNFLDRFPGEEIEILLELRLIEEDVKRLKQELNIEKDPEDAQENLAKVMTPQEELPETVSSEYQRFPLLLQKPDDDEDELRKLLVEFDGTGNRITRWLMHKLKSSCSEVELLFRLSREEGNNSDDEEWQQEVISFWYTDSTNLPSSTYKLNATIQSTTIMSTSTCSNEMITQPGFEGDEQI